MGNLLEPAFVHEDVITINNQSYIVVDAVLTGLDLQKDSLVSIGAVKMKGSRIELGKTFYKVVKPKSAFKLKNILFNGITPSEAEKKPDIESVIREFGEFCGKDIIVGHSMSIDMSFINKNGRKAIDSIMGNPMLDTLLIYEHLRKKHPALKHLFPYAGDSDLFKLARRFGIAFNDAHDALKVAFVTAQLFQKFIIMLIDVGIEKIDDLLSFGNPYAQESRYMVSGNIMKF